MSTHPATSPSTLDDALLATLRTLPTLTLDTACYLSLNAAHECVADHLFPDGVQSEVDYQCVTETTRSLCTQLGFGEAVTLNPPQVPFAERGDYLKQLPVVSDEHLQQALETVLARIPLYLTTPHRALRRDSLLFQVAYCAWGVRVREVTPVQLAYLAEQCDPWMEARGWELLLTLDDEHWSYASDPAYRRALEPDRDALTRALVKALRDGFTSLETVRRIGLQAAFHYNTRTDPEERIAAAEWQTLFAQLGYQLDASGERLEPIPLMLPEDATTRVCTALSELSTYAHKDYESMLARQEVLAATTKALALDGETLTAAREEALVTRGVVGEALVALGYENRAIWLPAYLLTPSPDQAGDFFRRAQQLQTRVHHPEFASGLQVHSPALVRDDATLVYLELVGPRQAVHANWAALRGARRTHYVAGGRLNVSKEDGLETLKRTLPCGWDHWALLHRQTSLETMQPREPFYLLDEGASVIPPLFFPMLARSLAMPLQATWDEHLWVQGRLRGLITSLSDASYGLGGWRVEAEEDVWREVVREGLQQAAISFGASVARGGSWMRSSHHPDAAPVAGRPGGGRAATRATRHAGRTVTRR